MEDETPRRLTVTVTGIGSTRVEIDLDGMSPWEAPLILDAAKNRVLTLLREAEEGP